MRNLRLNRVSRCWWATFAVLSVGVIHAEIEWRGTIIQGDRALFALNDTKTGKSQWVPLGGAFETYSVEHYDPQRQVIVLNGGGSKTELWMTTSSVAPDAGPNQTIVANPPVANQPGQTPAPTNAPSDDLRALSGIPLAEALAARGDAQMRDLLARYRAAAIARDTALRKLATAERANSGAGAPASVNGAGSSAAATPNPGGPSDVNAASGAGDVTTLRADAQRFEAELTRLTSQIEKTAAEKQRAAVSASTPGT